MESNNIDGASGEGRSPIPVINGEAKPSTGRKKKVFFSLASVILVAGLGTSLFLLQEERQRANEFSDQAYSLSQEKAKLEAQSQPQLPKEESSQPSKEAVPKGWSEHAGTSEGFSFFHPNDWKVSEPKSSGFGDYKPVNNLEVSESTSGTGPKANITLQRYEDVSKDELFKVLKSKQYWDGKCTEHTSVIAETLVYGLSCGPELNGKAITNYYVLERGSSTFLIYHDQMAGHAGPQQQALIYQGVLSSLSFGEKSL